MSNIDIYSVEQMAEYLEVEEDVLYDLTLDEISQLSIAIASEKNDRVNKIIDDRDKPYRLIRDKQKEDGLTDEVMTKMYFGEKKEISYE